MKKKSITITIDDKLIKEYGEQYFKKHPRASVHPLAKMGTKASNKTCGIGRVFPPTLNEYTNHPNRLVQSGVKNRWKEFVCWLCDKEGMSGWNLKKAEVKYSWIFGDKIRRDADNMIMNVKIINDGFTESKVWEDDNFGTINLILDTDWHIEKDKPKIIIEIKEL